MKAYRQFFLISVLVFLSCSALAQQRAVELSGTLQGSENEPVAFSTVALLNQDSTYIAGALSDEKGTFLIPIKCWSRSIFFESKLHYELSTVTFTTVETTVDWI
ncbi:MAG: carboxypeptidase regulatory-like domain-containing protein [Cyclobacteriaceae bacterium]